MAFEGTFKEFGNEKVFCGHVKPKNMDDPKCLVYICHGFGDYLGFYDELAEYLSKQGFYVFGNDHYGHGRSSGHRAWIPSYDVFLGPAKMVIEETAKLFPGKKVFIYGHSMGGLISLQLLEKYPSLADGLILESPFLDFPDMVPTWVARIGVFLGRYRVSRCFPVSKIDSKLLSRTAKVIESYDQDPLIYHGPANALFAASSFDAKNVVFEHAKEFTLPIFVGHGPEDKVCPYSGSSRLIEEIASEDKILKPYNEAVHILRLEAHQGIGEAFVKDIVDWIHAHC